MRVRVGEREYTLYTSAQGVWVMHTWRRDAPEGQAWVATDYDVSNVNPFASRVEYDAWL